jgi:SAM-dependent methyltransferase
MRQAAFEDFVRYLTSKVSVDDRALHLRVWSTFVSQLGPGTADSPLRVLEAGAGIGTMLVRLLDRGLLTHADYDAVEADAHLATAAQSHVRGWAESHGWEVDRSGDALRLGREEREVRLRWHTNDIRAHRGEPADVLLAHAFLDLVDLPQVLPAMLHGLKPQGIFLFSLTFDGLTGFLPEEPGAFEDDLLRAYHRTMDHRRVDGVPSGHSRSGRRLLGLLPRMGAVILDAGPSDWLVLPHDGGYPGDEAYFLHFIVETMQGAVRGEPELDAGMLEAWASKRHGQVERGELVLMAHQWDVVGKRAPMNR